ncbi:GNAT family N-acetyltransferase [Vibrio ruber]|uniref:GNAT family N-acetyltransferase n=1 Tax=Vibrio ruber TaxID=184755 RepID=UPI00289302C6|nr:GNAT family N-acetyltransferase [Vibrio ruber]WNJ95231.1 GNAT family N-acetyltransferase [Vibrio ruber]
MNNVICSKYGITLRKWNDEDIQGYATLASDEENMKFISSGHARTIDIIKDEVERFRQNQEQKGWARWVVSQGPSAPFMGYAGFEEKQFGINFGMRYLPKYWGTPWTYLAGHTALCWAFDVLGFTSVYTLTNIKHTRAIQMNLKYLNLDRDQCRVVSTPFGDHLKIDYDRDNFFKVRDKNESTAQKLHQYIQKQEARETVHAKS